MTRPSLKTCTVWTPRRKSSAGNLPLLLAFFAALPQLASAAAAGGGIAEWETPLNLVVTSITGPVAFGISAIGIVVSGGMLIWGGELNEFARRMIMVVLVIAMIITAINLLQTLFGVGALV
jgi:type IV secretory pathway VirB2 component (pilin)